MEMKINEKTSDYCKDCKHRKENSSTNDKDFCEIGFTQNPRTLNATFNVAKNDGIWSVCPSNPWRLKAMMRLGYSDNDHIPAVE